MSTSHESARMHFIVSMDVKKADPDTRKLIRSHVMLGKNKGKSRPPKPRRATSRVVMADSEQSQLVTFDASTETYFLAIPGRVGSDLSFTEFADKVEPIILADAMKFSIVAKTSLFPLAVLTAFDGKDTTWFDPLMFDAAYLHVTAFAAQAFFGVLGQQNHTNDQKATFHFLKGVQLLRKRLFSGDEQAKVSDTTIVVVLTLAISAYFMRDYETSRQHMMGLHKMINLRGGLAAFKGNILLMIMFRCDIGLALQSGSKPMFFNDSFSEPFVPYPDQKLLAPRKNADTTCPRYNPENFLRRIDAELATAWRAMQRFCSEANLATQSHGTLPPDILMDTMASVMYRLLHMTGFHAGSVDEAICLGLLAFCDHIFLQTRYMLVTYPHLPSTYRNCLCGLRLTDGVPSQIMLWLLMVGAISIFTSDDAWLKECLREHIDLCQAKSWNEMRDILKSVIWIDIMHDIPGKGIFDSALSN